MDIINDKSQIELIDSLLAEVAKSQNELRCAQRDLAKAAGRLNFAIMIMNRLREKGSTDETH